MALMSCTNICFAQGPLAITGIIKDVKGEPLPGAGVYLSGYQAATVADNDGKFTISNLKSGNYDVLVQVIGFLPQNKNVLLTDKNVSIEIVLQENVTQLNEVVIKADPNRQYYINLFKKCFIGTSPNADKCVIINPEVIQTDYDKQNRILRVTANDFLIIENKALGYRIKYLLGYFENDEKTNILFYSGHPHFEELEKNPSRVKRYNKIRETAYLGSSQHFFSALYHNRIKEDGFIIHKLARVPNTSRPSDEVISANLRRLTSFSNGARSLALPNDSLNYWKNMRREPKVLSLLDRENVLVDTLVKSLYMDLKSITYKDALYVVYTKEKETNTYRDFSGHFVTRPGDLGNYQISIVNQLIAPSSFYENGGIFDPRSLLYEGYWAYEKVADMVPMDYQTNSKK
ncbi:MAG: carboxypeptidase-like regulatory domain-containing protein [Pedobacter sp.]|nr:MAG: carboxypeptidase-like regulatory domain-containing protein [Pedobacter sp.]